METNPMVNATVPGFIRPGSPEQIAAQMPFRSLVTRPASNALADGEPVVLLTGAEAHAYRAVA